MTRMCKVKDEWLPVVVFVKLNVYPWAIECIFVKQALKHILMGNCFSSGSSYFTQASETLRFIPQIVTETKGCANISWSTLVLVLYHSAKEASGSWLYRLTIGLDVGSAGLFWLRGTGLHKHAKLAASSKRISGSRELRWNLLFLSLSLSSLF